MYIGSRDVFVKSLLINFIIIINFLTFFSIGTDVLKYHMWKVVNVFHLMVNSNDKLGIYSFELLIK